MLSHANASLSPPVVLSATGDHIRVPGADWLGDADIARDGGDLLLTGSDGVSMVVPGYFDLPAPPALVDDGGMMVSGDWAVRLAGPLAPGQYAQAGGATPAPAIGTVSNATGQVQVRHADGTQDAVKNGDSVKVGDIISTGGGGKVGITFDDGSTFALGGNGRMSVDDMTLPDAGGGGGKEVLAIEGGSFSFSSGAIAKSVPDAMQLKTPVATIGVRGTTGAGVAGPEGQSNTVSLLPDADGTVGQMSVSNQAGTQMLSQPGATTQFTSAFTAPPPPVILSPQQIQQQYGDTLQALPPPPSPEQLQQQQQQRQADAATEAQQQAEAEAAEKAAAEQAATEAEAENALNAEGEAARDGAETDLFGSLNDLAQALGTDLGLFGLDGQNMMNEIDDLFAQMLGDDGPLFGEFGEFGEFDLAALLAEAGLGEFFELTGDELEDILDELEGDLDNPPIIHDLAVFSSPPSFSITVTDDRVDLIIGRAGQADSVTIDGTLDDGDTFIDRNNADGDSLTLDSTGPNRNWWVAGVETIDLSQTTGGNSFTIGNSGQTAITLSNHVDTIDTEDFTQDTAFYLDGQQTWSLSGLMAGDSIDMGEGQDILKLVDAGPHSATLRHVETLTFEGSGIDFTSQGVLDGINITGSAGSDKVTLAGGGNAITIDAVESVVGGSGTDRVTLADGGQTIAVSGVETVTGGSGNDIITGSAAAESLVGNDGADTLIGGGGADSLSGGSGSDVYKYTASSEFGDTIDALDFSNGGGDTFAFSASIFASALLTGAIANANFQSAADVNNFISDGSGDYFAYNTANNTLYCSTDGTGSNWTAVAQITTTTGTISYQDIDIV